MGEQGKSTNIVEVTSVDMEGEGEDEEGIVEVRVDDGEELTEDDVERAIEEGMSPGERLFAEVAINIAEEVGIFGGATPATVGMKPAAIATFKDMAQYASWEEEIASITRNEPQHSVPTALIGTSLIPVNTSRAIEMELGMQPAENLWLVGRFYGRYESSKYK